MDLKHYLYINNLTTAEFSKKLSCSRPHLCMIKVKKKKPGFRLAKDIEELTGGQVTVEELMKMDK